MGQFLSRLVAILTGLQERRLLLLGLDAAGKTSLLYKLKLDKVVDTLPTIGFNVETVENKKVAMTVWDIGGQAKIRPLYRHYYPNTEALIYVIDSSDQARSEEARDYLLRLLRESDMVGCCTVLIMLNKQDLPDAMSPAVMAEKLDLNGAMGDLLRHRNWHIQACSVRTGEGVFEGLDWLSEALRHHQPVTPIVTS